MPNTLRVSRDRTCWRLPTTVAPSNGADFVARHVVRVDLPLRDAVVALVAAVVVLPSAVGALRQELVPSAEALPMPLVAADEQLPVEQVLPAPEQAVVLRDWHVALVRFPRALYGVCVVAREHELVLARVVLSAVAAVLLAASSAPLSVVAPEFAELLALLEAFSFVPAVASFASASAT